MTKSKQVQHQSGVGPVAYHGACTSSASWDIDNYVQHSVVPWIDPRRLDCFWDHQIYFGSILEDPSWHASGYARHSICGNLVPPEKPPLAMRQKQGR